MLTAFLVIDMQAALMQRAVHNKQGLIDNVNRLLDMSHANDGLVIFARHTNTSFSKVNTDDWQIDGSLHQYDSDTTINKTHSSVFKEKAFLTLLKDMGVSRIIVCGLVSNGCVQTACLDAMKHGFAVTLIGDAHSTWQKDAEKVIDD